MITEDLISKAMRYFHDNFSSELIRHVRGEKFIAKTYTDYAKDFLETMEHHGQMPQDLHPDIEADGIVFCGKCGKIK